MPINKPSQPLIPAEIDPAVLDGKADLVNGEVPSDQLPSYVDDVLEFASSSEFPADVREDRSEELRRGDRYGTYLERTAERRTDDRPGE